MTDEGLWDAIRRDDELAFKVLYERYWSIVFATAFSYLQDRSLCGEIVHDIFLSIWMKRKTLEIASFYSYLTAAARYQVYKRLQQRGTLKIVYTDSLSESTGKSVVNEGEYNVRYHELQVSVDQYLKDLPERCREIFQMSRKEHLSIAEIAERLNISRRTVENQLTRALQHLRHSLGDLSILFIVTGTAIIIS